MNLKKVNYTKLNARQKENYNYHNLIAVINLKNNFDNINNPNYSLSNKISRINNKKSLKEIVESYFELMKKSNIIKSEKNKIKNNKFNNETTNDPFDNINKVKNLKYILLADYGKRDKVTKTLIENNWSLENKFVQNSYKTTLLLFKKN